MTSKNFSWHGLAIKHRVPERLNGIQQTWFIRFQSTPTKPSNNQDSRLTQWNPNIRRTQQNHAQSKILDQLNEL